MEEGYKNKETTQFGHGRGARMGKKLLVVDDDPNICEVVRLYARKEQFEVVTCHDGNQAASLFRKENPDVVVLDIMLPGRDGWEVCREIRAMSLVPIIMLTAKGEIFDKVQGFELGADDYVVKPFDPLELMARIHAVLRRAEAKKSWGDAVDKEDRVVRVPGLEVSLSQYTVQVDGEKPAFTPKEVELLYYLASHPNRVFTREDLMEAVWGYDFNADVRGIDVYIKRIRKKLEPVSPEAGQRRNWDIKTVWGVGYKFQLD
jgi:two-component system OmpR family response regulator